jgi:cell shape-determining protein MreC
MKYCTNCQKFVPSRHFRDFTGKGHTEGKYPGDNIKGDIISSYRERFIQLTRIIEDKEATIAEYQNIVDQWKEYNRKSIKKLTDAAAKRIEELEGENTRLRKRLSRYE